MAVVIDANCGHKVVRDADYIEIREWFLNDKAKIAISEDLFKELYKKSFKPFYDEMKKLQRVRVLDGEEENRVDEAIPTILPIIQSDDPHILAMMIVGDFRLIVTEDNDLREDVKNKEIINGPRGKIYSEGTSKKRRGQARKLLEKLGSCGD